MMGVSILYSLALLSSALSPVALGVTLTVSKTGGNASSPLLYGVMFEDINNSGDGGIHGQVLKNNGFQGDNPGLTAYAAVGNVTLSQDTSNPLSSAITSSLKVSVPSGATGFMGFANTGYNGVPVLKATYANYFWMKGTYSGVITVRLVGSESDIVYASQNITVNSNSSAFSYYETSFSSAESPDGNNEWQLLFDAAEVAGSSLNFGLVQLFPPTYNDRYNGLRDDVASFMADIQPSFLRFPGGNNLLSSREGASTSNRWKWNETIGPVVDRPGREGDWGYPNTDALGLDEYLYWCEDMGLTPILAVWDGHSFGEIVSGSDLDPYVDDILDELEYVLGDVSTPYGALRAKNGRTDPWPVKYIEVGNEDNLSEGCDTYASRFTQIYDAIHAQYPNLTLIASTTDSSCLPSTLPPGVWTDIHYYETPDEFVSLFNEWDNWSRDRPIFVGEYASTTGNDGSTTYWSNMQGSCSEAVYMIGLERNSDIVKAASFAPVLEHFDLAEWSPDLYGLDSSPGSLTGSTSYYVQKMFSTNRGTAILPVTSDTGFGPVYWVASVAGSTYYVKLANYGSSAETVTVEIEGTSSGKLEMLSGGEFISNYPHNVSISTQTSDVSGSGSFTISLPAWAVGVLAVS
ncbi:putative alpha-L-arabinofuranosidase A [Talaromyces atroroseus]|uniref:non-reducing end alpha-L-arabinofuranosidase n=1 Tax=Talaromyces atroroseus TaxID=1441469 RepID=A0A225ASQ2_TALAT|nr:putative alpha-L-arabinofuranosidase A [Talaromyces atroroseus]OKL61374.1 putative alpha-L-arabinofuranosidase A [Talaromyces atroroseus]